MFKNRNKKTSSGDGRPLNDKPMESFETLAYELLEQALIADIELEYFWDSSYANIILKLQAYAERNEIERKRDAINNYTLAQLVGVNVAAMFSKNGKVPPIEKCFPHLFTEEDLATQSKEEVVPEGSLCAAEANFLSGIIHLHNLRNQQKRQNTKE